MTNRELEARAYLIPICAAPSREEKLVIIKGIPTEILPLVIILLAEAVEIG